MQRGKNSLETQGTEECGKQIYERAEGTGHTKENELDVMFSRKSWHFTDINQILFVYSSDMLEACHFKIEVLLTCKLSIHNVLICFHRMYKI